MTNGIYPRSFVTYRIAGYFRGSKISRFLGAKVKYKCSLFLFSRIEQNCIFYFGGWTLYE